jgi:signal transduction histidine kinase/CheY-like chemotaxis protein
MTQLVNLSVWLPPSDKLVQYELFLLDYRNLLPHMVGQVGMALLITGASWDVVQHPVLLTWLAWMLFSALVLLLARIGFNQRVKTIGTQTSREVTLQLWNWLHPVMLIITGMGWGGAGWLFVSDSPAQNFTVMTAFSGTLAYSVLSNAPYDPRGFGISACLAMAMLASKVPGAYGSYTWFTLGMCGMYLVVMVLAAHNARVTLLQSITLRLANENLARVNAQTAQIAERANRDKSEFLAAASHDLRQPVHALLLLIEAYRQEAPANANHPLMQHIQSAGHSIRDLFNALMELSRLESGTEKLIPTTFDLQQTLGNAVQRMQPEARSKHLTLRCAIVPSLRQHFVHTDKLLLERVLGNLMSNAVRYTHQGGILLSLRHAHASKTATRGLWLEVWDTGIGIADADRERIFSPYVQIGNRERDRSMGLGLGLAIVSHAVALLGLQLTLLSQPQRGSCFRIFIPLALLRSRETPQLPATATSAQPGHQPSHALWTQQLAGRRILLIEDDAMARLAMQALLTGWKIDLRCAQVGDASVLNVCGPNWQPECVLSDFRLPGSLNGIEILDLLLEYYPQAVGILQTGELAQAVQTQAEEAGYLVLFKPLDPSILASTLCAVLDTRNAEAKTLIKS